MTLILNEYFQALTFKRAEEKQGFVLYVAAIASLIGGDKRQYIIAFVPQHLAIQTTAKLSDLWWSNLQMRLCPINAYQVPSQQWKAPSSTLTVCVGDECRIVDPSMITLHVIDRQQNYSTFHSEDLPYEILMIHSPKKKSIYQYPNTMNLHWAIDQFQTIFNSKTPIQQMETSVPQFSPVPQTQWYHDTGNYTSGVTNSSFELL